MRLLVKSGAEVRVVMTDAAKDFITPLTLSTLSKNPVLSDFSVDETGEWNNHVELGLWADLMLVAPVTANTLSKMVSGQADSFLLACYLSARCPVAVAPAMDLDMYLHPSTKENIRILEEREHLIIKPEHGELASGLVGGGRLSEPENILEYLEKYFDTGSPLDGKKILITAGPTFENIDPIRFIGNNSSGKMGFALAKCAAALGADVTLLAGPVVLETPEGVNRINYRSAKDLFELCKEHLSSVDVLIMAAAVADYTPQVVSDSKIKKQDGDLDIKLERTQDILKWVGEHKGTDQLSLGFALETENLLENGKGKLIRKNLDAIVLNSLEDQGAGFQVDTNKISILDRDNKLTKFELKSKDQVAQDILGKVIELLN